jgi:F-type H+-transporting ATPase subunit epsilon
MSPTLRLSISTPASILVDAAEIASLRAEDESGSFGILAGHADFLTVLTP